MPPLERRQLTGANFAVQPFAFERVAESLAAAGDTVHVGKLVASGYSGQIAFEPFGNLGAIEPCLDRSAPAP